MIAERVFSLNKDNQTSNNYDNKKQPIKYQQFVPPGQRQPSRPPAPPGFGPGPDRPSGPEPGPGRPPGPPGFGPGPDRPPGPPGFGPGPGAGRPPGQPPTAPPNFTPQLPREESQQLSGPSEFGGVFGRRSNLGRTPRSFRGCMNRFTYIWLINGNNFWFYPVSASRNTIEGFRWRRNRWEYDRILVNRILFHLCF